ncbi:uncharacterized protein LOC136090780 [Hydra vulgaris]|uniref:Uncharacterized protein LOC136090780 n=1 Tax=Hydra vulgaris TaxID=6087 RepID=A0ABM4DH12_HYDVU
MRKTTQDLWSFIGENFSLINIPIKNGCILYLKYQSKKTLTESTKILTEYLPKADVVKLKTAIKRTEDGVLKFKKVPDRYWFEIVNYCDMPFRYQPKEDESTKAMTSIDLNTAFMADTTDTGIADTTLDLNIAFADANEIQHAAADGISCTTGFSNRKGCPSCFAKKQSLRHSRETVQFLRYKLKIYKNLKFTNRNLTQKENRKSASLTMWKQKYFHAKDNQIVLKSLDHKEYINSIRKLKISNSKLRTQLINLLEKNRSEAKERDKHI